MALRTITIVASLVVLAAIHIRGEDNQETDTPIQSSHFHQVSNADIQKDFTKSRIMRSSDRRVNKGRKNINKRDPKPGRKSGKGNKKKRKVMKANKNRNKSKNGKGRNNKITKRNKRKNQKGQKSNVVKTKNRKKITKKRSKNKPKKGRTKNKKKSSKKKNKKRGKTGIKGKKGRRGKSIKKRRKNKGKKTNVKKSIKKRNKRKRKSKKGSRNRKKVVRKDKKNKKKAKKDRKKSKQKKRNNTEKPIQKQKKLSRKKKLRGKVRAVVCEDCVVKLSNYAKLYVAQAKNRKQQILRLEAACKTSKKKVAKKEEFDTTYKMLLANAGGNGSDPKCKGKSIGKAIGSSTSSSVSIISSSNNSVSIISSSNSSTSRQDTATDGEALVTDMTTLLACNKSIGEGCNTCQLDDPAQKKKAEDCKKAMVSFISKMDNCLNVTQYANQEALCTCVDGIDDANKTLENQIRKCKWVTAASSKEVNNKKKCIGVFSACRKAEDASVGHLHKCKLPLIKCGGVTTVDEAKKDLPILKNLKKELDATEAKMKSGFTNNGLDALNTTKDSKTPSGLSDFIKNPSGSSRAASKCRQLAQAFLKFNESAKGTGESANSDMNGTEASNTTDILKQMKTRDFDSEVSDCKKSTKQQTVLLIIIRFYGATMVLWRTTIIDVKIVVLGLVISNAAKEDTSTTTVDPSATTAEATTAGATTAGASTAGATTAGATTAGATTAGATTAGATTAGATTAGATTAGATTAGATTAGATTAGATTAGATTAGATTAGATTAGATTAGATTAGATTAGATTAGASTAGATTAGATTAGATTAGATTAGATTAGATTAGTSTAAVSTARAQGRKKKFLDRMLWLQQKVLKA